MLKRVMTLVLVLCLLLAGCANSPEESIAEPAPAADQASDAAETVQTEDSSADSVTSDAAVEEEPSELAEPAKTIAPLPDTTMDNLSDAILSVSLEEGDAYVDDSGIMQMDLKIYTYDRYDMIDIAMLEVGDIIVRHSGEVEVTAKEQNEAGTILINGGLEAGGFELTTDDCGIFFETGVDGVKNWYEVGTSTIRVSADFRGIDNAASEQGEVILYPGSFLVGEVTNYDFTPYNTTIRVEEGQIVELNRTNILPVSE